jgi:WD40 repeat protein
MPMRKELLQKLRKSVKETSILTQSQKLGIAYATLYRIVKGDSDGSIRIWEKIETKFKSS